MAAMHLPVVTAIAAAVLLLMQVALTLSVILVRWRVRQSLGDSPDPMLLRAVRRHGNFAENVAIFLIGLAVLEMFGSNKTTLEVLASVFIVGRTSHAIGLSKEKTVNTFRSAGVILTVFVDIALALLLLLGTKSWIDQ